MTRLRKNDFLQRSSYNHARYLTINHVRGHFERKGMRGFTGVTPGDRAQHVGYAANDVLENVSYGGRDVKDSIDALDVCDLPPLRVS
ncbi:hypothetical protein NKDENANG_01383 [Candidatus Entotheonellaceae bacterium PAL068K]